MGTIGLNITMDENLYERLSEELPPKDISAFINAAVRARLHPDRETLDAAYRKASREAWPRSPADDWQPTETENWPE